VTVTPKTIEDLLMASALVIFTSSILITALAIAYRVAIRPLIGDVARLRTGVEIRLAAVEEQIHRLGAASGQSSVEESWPATRTSMPPLQAK
jgi:hypothetical protein